MLKQHLAVVGSKENVVGVDWLGIYKQPGTPGPMPKNLDVRPHYDPVHCYDLLLGYLWHWIARYQVRATSHRRGHQAVLRGSSQVVPEVSGPLHSRSRMQRLLIHPNDFPLCPT